MSCWQDFRGGYFAPLIDAAEFSVEQGFAVSGNGSADWENGGEDNKVGDF